MRVHFRAGIARDVGDDNDGVELVVDVFREQHDVGRPSVLADEQFRQCADGRVGVDLDNLNGRETFRLIKYAYLVHGIPL